MIFSLMHYVLVSIFQSERERERGKERERERERKMVSILQLISFKMYREEQRAWSTHSQVAPMRIDLKHWDSQLLNIDV